MCHEYGITFKDLKYKLEKDIHELCIEYNLFFYKTKKGYWSIKDKFYDDYYIKKDYH